MRGMIVDSFCVSSQRKQTQKKKKKKKSGTRDRNNAALEPHQSQKVGYNHTSTKCFSRPLFPLGEWRGQPDKNCERRRRNTLKTKIVVSGMKNKKGRQRRSEIQKLDTARSKVCGHKNEL